MRGTITVLGHRITLNKEHVKHVTPKYNFSRTWHVADYDWKDYTEVITWCEQNFGPHPKIPDAWSRWHDKYDGKVLLRDEKDYVLFTLRWS